MKSIRIEKVDGIWMVTIRYAGPREHSSHSEHATVGDALKEVLDAANTCKEE